MAMGNVVAKSSSSKPLEQVAPAPVAASQFGIAHLCALSVTLIVATTAAIYFMLLHVGALQSKFRDADLQAHGEENAWGELMTSDLEIEQPEEYVAFEATTNRIAIWHFDSMGPSQARQLLLQAGLTEEQANHLLSSQFTSYEKGSTNIRPDDSFVISLSPEIRNALYGALAAIPGNRYMQEPYRFPAKTLDNVFRESDISPETIELVKKLLYKRGDNYYFSDLEVTFHRVKTQEEGLNLLKVLTRQPAVLPRLRIRPTTDIDKLVNYWGTAPGVRLKDLRPLMEAVKRLPDGGSISILYLLPPFAREHLFTSPLPTQPNQVAPDCHWSALNFFRETPDNRFSDPAYASQYVRDNFYEIAKPSLYGDLVFLIDQNGGVIHSAVYIADDIVFTKNGINYAQPWILMRINNMADQFSSGLTSPKIVYFREKNS